MVTFLWVVLGFSLVGLLLAVTARLFGRGMWGAEYSESHYLDEVEAQNRIPGP